MIVADKQVTLILTAMATCWSPRPDCRDRIGRQLRARPPARALVDYEDDAETIARKAMAIAAEVCVFTNGTCTIETMESVA